MSFIYLELDNKIAFDVPLFCLHTSISFFSSSSLSLGGTIARVDVSSSIVIFTRDITY